MWYSSMDSKHSEDMTLKEELDQLEGRMRAIRNLCFHTDQDWTKDGRYNVLFTKYKYLLHQYIQELKNNVRN